MGVEKKQERVRLGIHKQEDGYATLLCGTAPTTHYLCPARYSPLELGGARRAHDAAAVLDQHLAVHHAGLH